ncbi:hypothetical protein EUA02_29975 [Mycobacterium paragordonae]|uniref:hypothetical protein n=1 Tax=Mycobacterium paragordonae TaxID=1389713 RepID=UPI001061AAB3|nr:hypothetical protein [Mycobacterium paragordonae]TDK85487.1 hypothetical protein EUA02_29975 [Mycobacterium paragordonae]TDK98941.1 hypothetical protein EUA05_31010 [Mycobacterium paragordonae]
MSSYKLLELFGARIVDNPAKKVRTIHMDFAPEDGAVAKAMRDGEGSEMEQAVRQIANEAAVIRAAYVPNADASQYGSGFFLPPAIARRNRAEHERVQAEREAIQDDEPGGMSAMWTQREEVN